MTTPRTSTTITLPSGIDESDLRAQWAELEEASFLHLARRSLFNEGYRLVSTAETPWGDEVRDLASEAYMRFLYAENFYTGGALRQMQSEFLTWLREMFHGDGDGIGVMTTGGSESNYLGLLAAKARAGHNGSIVVPRHAHYSFFKACRMFDMTPIVVDPDPNDVTRIDPDALIRAIRHDTIAVALTAGTMPFGSIDPIAEVAEYTSQRGLYLHVDACCGGFILPFAERTGIREVPAWDFRVPGVDSIAADVHKHGLSAPPCSTFSARDQATMDALIELCPPQGTLTGTRSAAPIAAAWTTMKALGIPGYEAATKLQLRLIDRIAAEVQDIPDIYVVPGSKINLMALHSTTIDLLTVFEELRSRGWYLIYKNAPAPVSILIWTLPSFDGREEEFLKDLREAVLSAPPLQTTPGSEEESAYGGIA